MAENGEQMQEIRTLPRLFPASFPDVLLAAVRCPWTALDSKLLIYQKKKGFNELH